MWQAVIRGNEGTFKYKYRVYNAFMTLLYVSFLSSQAIIFPRLLILNLIGNERYLLIQCSAYLPIGTLL